MSLTQRIRWAKGHLQSSVENCPKLLKNVFKFNKTSIRSYDMFFLNFPGSIESVCRKLLSWAIKIIIGIMVANVWGVIAGILVGILSGYVKYWLSNMFEAAFVFCYYHKYMPKMNFFKWLFCVFMYPFFGKIGTWCSYIALFKKVEWKKIPHDYTVDVSKLK